MFKLRQQFICNIILILAISFFLFAPIATLAGVIDDVYKYAWGEKIGWLNFKTDKGNVQVEDDYLSGYVWSENYGWINLRPSDGAYGGVINDGNGNLSGYAWGENLGWINFDPPGEDQVTIDGEGYFHGRAYGELTGWIVFNCDYNDNCSNSNYKVKTNWTFSAEEEEEVVVAPPKGGGGPPKIIKPPIFYTVLINNGAEETDKTSVILTLNGGIGATKEIQIFNYHNLSAGVTLDYRQYVSWELIPLTCQAPCQEYRTVYVKFIDFDGRETFVLDSIILKESISEVIVDPKPIPPEKPTEEIEEPSIIVKPPVKPPTVVVVPPEKLPEVEVKPPYLGEAPTLLITSPASQIVEPPAKSTMIKEPAELPLREPIVTKLIDLLRPKLIAQLPFIQPFEGDGAPSLAKLFNFLIPGFATERLEEPKSLIVSLVINLPGFIAPDVFTTQRPLFAWLTNFFRSDVKLPSLEEIVPEKAPIAMRGEWELLPPEPVVNFVFAPLTNQIKELATNLPQFRKLAQETGIRRISDLFKFTDVNLILPVFTDFYGTPENQKLEFLTKPIDSHIVKRVPNEIIFIKSLGGIDIPSSLINLELGVPKQKIRILTSQALIFIVKPSAPAKKVTGQLVFYDHDSLASIEELTGLTREELKKLSLEELLALGLPYETLRIILAEFDYHDDDGDGVWIANIFVPDTDGYYEVVTNLDYKEDKFKDKEISVVMMVDPKGYIYEELKDNREVRISGAVVSIFKFKEEAEEYELWEALEFLQENPQITDNTGQYSFLVPEGDYYIEAEVPGYIKYKSNSFSVKIGGNVNFDIALKPKMWRLSLFNREWIILILLILFLSCYFYRDYKRRQDIKKRSQSDGLSGSNNNF